MFVAQENAMQIYRVAVKRHSETIMAEQTAVILSRQALGEVTKYPHPAHMAYIK
jgi:hypothetical protein